VSLDDALKRGALVRTVAKRLAFGETATAETNFGAAAETVGVAFLVYDFDFAVNEQRSVVHNCDFHVWHSILRSRIAEFWPLGARRPRMMIRAA
jgi:hypothetical protein